MTKQSDLLAQLTTAVARAPKRKPRASRATGELTPEAAAVLEEAHKLKLAEAKSALDAAAEREERAYYRRFGRLKVLGQRATAVKRALAECKDEATRARLERLSEAINSAREAVFAQPVIADDLKDGGRFWKRAVWLGLNVGMLAIREDDIVSGAVELCYVKGQLAENARGDMMPTLGGMYRNMRLYYHGQLDRFRRNKSAGVVAVHSLEELFARLGSDWIDAEAHRIDNLGFGYASQDDVNDWGTMRPVSDLEASRAALAFADAERQREKKRREREMVERDTLAMAATAPAGYDRASFEADRVAIRVLINGGSIADVAAVCNVKPAAIVKRLLELEGALGATRYSGDPHSVPLTGSASRGQVFTPPRAPAEKRRHETKEFSSSREGTRATAVLVSTK